MRQRVSVVSVLSFLPVLSLLLAVSAAGQYHAPLYVLSSVSFFGGGEIMIVDLRGTPRIVSSAQLGSQARPPVMDRDNNALLFPMFDAQRSAYTLSRMDPLTGQVSTILTMPATSFRYRWFSHVDVDQDGNYLCFAHDDDFTTVPMTRLSWLLSMDPSGLLTTLLSQPVGGREWVDDMIVDIHTGDRFVSVSQWTFNRPKHQFWTLDTQFGLLSPHTPPIPGPHPGHVTSQNFATGAIEGIWKGHVIEVTPTKVNWTGRFSPEMRGFGRFDNQNAARSRFVLTSWAGAGKTTDVVYMDRLTFKRRVRAVHSRWTGFSYLDIWGSRNTQPLRTGLREWDVMLSAPAYPGRPYAIAIGMSGVRPSLRLADSRGVHFVPDALTALSLTGRLAPLFTPGPGVLDGRGKARAELDLSTLPTLGLPLWICWAVLDPNAPLGIAFIPDTFVMRI